MTCTPTRQSPCPTVKGRKSVTTGQPASPPPPVDPSGMPVSIYEPELAADLHGARTRKCGSASGFWPSGHRRSQASCGRCRSSTAAQRTSTTRRWWSVRLQQRSRRRGRGTHGQPRQTTIQNSTARTDFASRGTEASRCDGAPHAPCSHGENPRRHHPDGTHHLGALSDGPRSPAHHRPTFLTHIPTPVNGPPACDRLISRDRIRSEH